MHSIARQKPFSVFWYAYEPLFYQNNIKTGTMHMDEYRIFDNDHESQRSKSTDLVQNLTIKVIYLYVKKLSTCVPAHKRII